MQIERTRTNKRKPVKSARSAMRSSERYNARMLRTKFNKPMEETQA